MSRFARPYVWTSQPQYPVGINWSDPLTNGLVSLFLMNSNSTLVDLVAMDSGVATGVPTASITAGGRTIHYAASTYHSFASTLKRSITGPLTIAARYQPDAAGVQAILTRKSTGDAANNAYALYGISTANGANSIYAVRAGATAYGAYATGANTVIPGAVNDVCITWNGSSTNTIPVIVTNGVSRAVTRMFTAGTATITDDGSALKVGVTNTDTGGTQDILYLGVWNRALSQSESLQLYVNPWKLFRAPKRRIGAVSAGGGGTSVPLSDSGSGSDAVAISVSSAVSDSGSGSEAVVISATTTILDAGTGSDAVSSLPIIPVSDSGTGTDSIISITASTPVADSGTGAESLTIIASVTTTDTALGADTILVSIAVPIADAASGADIVNITGLFPVSDTGSGAEAVTVGSGSTGVTILDIGVGAESINITAAISLAETGLSADSVTVSSWFVRIIDIYGNVSIANLSGYVTVAPIN